MKTGRSSVQAVMLVACICWAITSIGSFFGFLVVCGIGYVIFKALGSKKPPDK